MAKFYEDHGPDFDYYYTPKPVIANMVGGHIHPQYEAALTLNPVPSKHYIGNTKIELNTAFFSICVPFCLHKYEHEIGAQTDRMAFHFGEKMYAEFAPAFACMKPYEQIQSTFFPLSPQLSEEIRPIFDTFMSKPRQSMEQKLLFLLILNTVIQNVDEKDVICTTNTLTYIQDVLSYLHTHYNEPLTVEELAKTFFISRSKLTGDFKKHTGVTIHQLLSEIRINRALYMIRYENWNSIQEIADSVGMGDSTQFYVLFKKMMGMSPLQYVKQFSYLKKRLNK